MTPDGRAFRFGFRVRYSEVDYQGIVYNAHYLTYFDVTIHEFCRWLPYDYTAAREATGTDFHTVKALVEWRRPLLFDELFEVELPLARIGRTSLTFTPAIRVEGETEPRVTGEIVWVHTDRAAGRAAPLPRLMLERLAERGFGAADGSRGS